MASFLRSRYLECCLAISILALMAQLGGPAVLERWRELPTPGKQTNGHFNLTKPWGGQTKIPYLVYLPADYSPNKRFPLLLFLHGSGECGNDLYKVKTCGPPAFITSAQDLPMIVVSPQCPANASWNNEPLLKLLDGMEKKFSVDPERIYVAGYSMGGTGTWEIIAAAPRRFAAAVPVAGAGEIATASRLAELPIWAFHGADDAVIPIECSKNIVDAIQHHGGKANLTILENKGHDICNFVFSQPDLYNWLLRQHN